MPLAPGLGFVINSSSLVRDISFVADNCWHLAVLSFHRALDLHDRKPMVFAIFKFLNA